MFEIIILVIASVAVGFLGGMAEMRHAEKRAYLAGKHDMANTVLLLIGYHKKENSNNFIDALEKDVIEFEKRYRE